jgi:AraC-like DNA-binding protein
MLQNESFLNLYKQHNKLPIRLISPDFGHLSIDSIDNFESTHRKLYYFFLFIIRGSTKHGVDLQEFEIKEHELLFILPHQIHRLPDTIQGTDYFKLGFDNECLAQLPRQYSFLINPFNQQKIQFNKPGARRLKAVFEILRDLLRNPDTAAELILAHLNSLLTEINTVYFAADKNPVDSRLSRFISFKLFIENNLTNQPSVDEIARSLALNTNSLYYIVKHYTGLSPKEFMTNRLMLEAKRRLYYAESSVKELAYDLGFNDPEYFSRLFKKETGKTITAFVQDLSGN